MSHIIEARAYPKEFVDEFVATKKNLIRTDFEQSNQNNAMRPLSVDDANPYFLSESYNLKVGQEYSFFEINKLKYDVQQSLFSLNTAISFPNDCTEITLYADLLDTATSRVISSFDHKTISSEKNLSYDVEQHIAINTTTDKFAVIVYADWKTSLHSTKSAAIFSYIFKDIAVKCNHLYPKKEEKYVRLPPKAVNAFQAPPNIPALLKDHVSSEHINIALFRIPDNTKDLDYLCEFNKDSAGNPYMCVPTVFELILHSATTRFCKPVTAICTISSLDPRFGGKYIVASSATENIEESKVIVDVDSNIVHVEMLKPWQVSFPYGGGFNPYDFSYEVVVVLHTITNGQTIPVPQTIYAISSIKDKSACLITIPHVSIRWGCLAESTLIKMADWSMKQIKDICIGDDIACKEGNKRVENIWRGHEDRFIRITTHLNEKFSPLLATIDHPILTVSGYKRAQDIVAGDVLIGEQGKLNVAGVSLEEKCINVCNLSFLDGNNTQTILANGIYVGDFACQNKTI